MKLKNIWSSSQSLLVIFDFKDNDQLSNFRKSLDKMLNSSQVNRLVIVVNIPKEIDKATLPPHFLIYYNSPNDYTFFGKMKDMQLEAELNKNYDYHLRLSKTLTLKELENRQLSIYFWNNSQLCLKLHTNYLWLTVGYNYS